MPAQRATGTSQERLEQHTYSCAYDTVARRSNRLVHERIAADPAARHSEDAFLHCRFASL